MAWTTELVSHLRYIINDIDSSTWTDTQLQNFIGIAAVFTGQELNKWSFPTFEFDTSGPTLTPDPTDSGDIVGMLIVVKAACLIANAEMKQAAAEGGFVVVDDKSRIETKGRIESASKAAEKFCSDYTDAIEAYKAGVAFTGTNDGQAILAPYANRDGDFIASIWGRDVT